MHDIKAVTPNTMMTLTEYHVREKNQELIPRFLIFIVDFFFIISVDDDIDGIPLDGKGKGLNATGGFVPSKWEIVDPEQIEAQAITTSKWDTLEPVAPDPPTISNASDDSFDSFENLDTNRDFDELKRMRLREIEIKTVQYQDELESGQRTLKSNWTIQKQTEHFRHKLLRKSHKEMLESPSVSSRRDLKRSPSPVTSSYGRSLSRRSPSNYGKKSRDSVSPAKSARSTKRARSRSRSYSSSPKRYARERASPSPVRLVKYDSKHNRYEFTEYKPEQIEIHVVFIIYLQIAVAKGISAHWSKHQRRITHTVALQFLCGIINIGSNIVSTSIGKASAQA